MGKEEEGRVGNSEGDVERRKKKQMQIIHLIL